MPVATPTADIVARYTAGAVRVTRRCEILNSDGTLWMDADIVTGQVSVDMSRDERRTCDVLLFDSTGKLRLGEGYLWYDKLIRLFRGVTWPGGAHEVPCGTFMIDVVEDEQRLKHRPRPRPDSIGGVRTPTNKDFTSSIHVTGRDRTKRMLTSKFTQAVTFKAGTPLDAFCISLAGNSGISAADIVLPWSVTNPAPVFTFDQSFDADTARWEAMKNTLTQYGYEAFFDATNVLVVREFQDPATMAPVWTFKTGATDGNLVAYKRRIDDSELFNHVIVRGGAENNAQYFWEVQVNRNHSPVHRDKIGDRVWSYASSTIASTFDAAKLAKQFLAVKALESFSVQLGSIVFPWLEGGNVVSFIDPADTQITDEPTNFLLTDFTIPFALGQMDANAKRLEIIS